jgi:hypothetical protein
MANTWPPEPFDVAFARFRELDAWWTGDTATLQSIYSTSAGTHVVNGQSYRGGVVGTLSKWWWGQPIATDEQRMKMHLPLAADLCTLSADLLFGEAPQVLFRKPATAEAPTDGVETVAAPWRHEAQDRLDQIIASDEAHAEWLLSGEYAAALGGAYVTVAWDPTISDHVFPKAYAADCVIPTFRHGRLVAARLWSEYREGNEVYRLIEDHTPGVIEYGLYRGTDKDLGGLVPMGTRSETAHYESLRNESDLEVAIANPAALPLSVKIGTGTERLAVVYMPNARPVRDWRKLGPLQYLGRSDLDGIQDLLDKVDQVWSSLMRDVDNGQGRLVVAEEALDLAAPGEGATFDTYRQVFTKIGATLGKSADGGMPIEQVQFDIRVEEHMATFDGLLRRIASTIGYSEAHLGLEGATGTQTATEITADLSDSERTRDKKAMYARLAMSRWALAALEIDAAVFGGDALGDLTVAPDVVFAPVSQADPEKLARTAQLLDAARAASRKEIVRSLHPDWDEPDIDAEVERIKQEMGTPAPDPATFDGDDPDDADDVDDETGE